MTRRNILFIGFITCLLSFVLSGCMYRPTVQQGNVINAAHLKAIKNGMTSSQIKSLLGGPLLINIYQDNRIVYVYTFQRGHHSMKEKRLIIYLKNNRVTNYWYDDQLPGTPVRLPVK